MIKNEAPHIGAGKKPMQGSRGNSLTMCNLTTPSTESQPRIADMLHRGSSNATSCRDLAALLGWTQRQVTRAIERERRAGTPICANGNGYFLPETDAEMDGYLRSLGHRETEIRATRAAIAQVRQQRLEV